MPHVKYYAAWHMLKCDTCGYRSLRCPCNHPDSCGEEHEELALEAPQNRAFFESMRVYPPEESDLDEAVPLPIVGEEHVAIMRKLMKPMTAAQQYRNVAYATGLKPKDVKAAVEGIWTLAAEQIKKSGSFKLAGMLNLKLKVRPATKAGEPASKSVKAIPIKKLKELLK